MRKLQDALQVDELEMATKTHKRRTKNQLWCLLRLFVAHVLVFYPATGYISLENRIALFAGEESTNRSGDADQKEDRVQYEHDDNLWRSDSPDFDIGKIRQHQ